MERGGPRKPPRQMTGMEWTGRDGEREADTATEMEMRGRETKTQGTQRDQQREMKGIGKSDQMRTLQRAKGTERRGDPSSSTSGTPVPQPPLPCPGLGGALSPTERQPGPPDRTPAAHPSTGLSIFLSGDHVRSIGHGHHDALVRKGLCLESPHKGGGSEQHITWCSLGFELKPTLCLFTVLSCHLTAVSQTAPCSPQTVCQCHVHSRCTINVFQCVSVGMRQPVLPRLSFLGSPHGGSRAERMRSTASHLQKGSEK